MDKVILTADMPPDEYHADPCEQPSLSASMAKLMHMSSPAHAYHYHPRLGGNNSDKEPSEAIRSGTLLHALVFNEPLNVVIAGEYQSAIDRREALANATRLVQLADSTNTETPDVDTARDTIRRLTPLPRYLPITPDEEPLKDFDAFRSNNAKAFKKEAIAHGWVPMTRAKFNEAIDKAKPMADAFDGLGIDFTTGNRPDGTVGYSELTIQCFVETPEGGIWVRVRLDFVVVGPTWIEIIDLKTTKKSAHPDEVGKLLANQNAGVQRAAYVHAARIAWPDNAHHIRFRFVVIESSSYCGAVMGDCDDYEQAIGEAVWHSAIETWSRGVHANDWPGYKMPLNGEFEAPSWRKYQLKQMMGYEA